jgi:hypothetical protein
MRPLASPPDAVVDPRTRALRSGSFRGGLPRVDLARLAPRALDRLLRHRRVRTDDGAVDLRFTPGGMHADRSNLGLVRARFLQPVGATRGPCARRTAVRWSSTRSSG